ncbi:MAG: hypothetical protein FWH26_04040 [Oscillospiraceae bacterium]|nr:hypothetical protein [Oscillospiraceae bacterium]
MKRVISVVLSVFLLGGLLLPFTSFAEEDVPEGFTPIYTAEDLDNIRNDLYGTYILMNDIDLYGIQWVPIGDPLTQFFGFLDGNGHIIKNLTITDSAYGGLFGFASGATIQNLGIVDCMIDVREVAAGIVAFTIAALTIKNCFVTGSVNSGIAGGIVGAVGTPAAVVLPPVSFQNCYSLAQVNATTPFLPSGGFFGDSSNTHVEISNCYFGGSADNAISAANAQTDAFYYLDTSVPAGYEPKTGETPLTQAEMRQQASFAGFDFDTPIWYIQEGESYPQLRPFETGNTDPEDPGEDHEDPENPADSEVPEDVFWWSSLPSWLKFILRWFCFGWIWM